MRKALIAITLCFLAGCFPPERKKFWKNNEQTVKVPEDYGAGKKP